MLVDPTIESLAAHMNLLPASGAALKLPRATQILLSSAQERLVSRSVHCEQGGLQHSRCAEDFETLNADALEEALREVILRHEALRTLFGTEGGSGDFRILETATISLAQVLVASEAEAVELAGREARQPFELAHQPPLRCTLVSWSDQDHVLVLNIHHIVCDGWSLGIIFRDLSIAYAAAISGGEPAWAAPRALYSDYAAWQKDQIVRGVFRGDMAYWKAELSGAPSLLALPTDRTRPSILSYAGSSTGCELSAGARNALESLAIRANVTPFTLLLAAWQILLYRYSQQEDIVIGVPVAGRLQSAAEEMVGCFVNTLAVRGHVSPEHTFLVHLQAVHAKMLGALTHQALPFELLVSSLGLERDLSRTPLFQVMIVLQDTPDADFGAQGLEVSPLHVHNGGSKFDLVLEITPILGAGYRLSLEFNTGIFLPQTAQRMLGQFATLLVGLICDESRQLKDSHHAERRGASGAGGGVGKLWGTHAGRTLHERFERQVRTHARGDRADGLRADGERIELSYAELNRRANAVAHRCARSVWPNQLVGLRIERSADLVIGILAILKAGGAYLPLDPVYPTRARRLHAGGRRRARWCSPSARWPASSAALPVTCVCLDEPLPPTVGEPRRRSPRVPATTSPTSSTPRARPASPRACWSPTATSRACSPPPTPGSASARSDVWTLFHSYAFDFSVWELWGALLYGGRAGRRAVLGRAAIAGRVPRAAGARARHGAQPDARPRSAQLIDADRAAPPTATLALRYVIFGGEALELQSLRPWFERHGDAAAAAGQHVRHHRDDGARHLPAAAPGRSRAGARQRRSACRSPICGSTCSTPRRRAGADRRARRAVRRRRRRRARLPEPARADRASASCPIRSAPSRGARLYRTGDLARRLRGRRPRVPRPHRPPGEDPRLPHRARRDRGGARAAPRACARSPVIAREDVAGRASASSPTSWPQRRSRRC